jgi:hypothetical protein
MAVAFVVMFATLLWPAQGLAKPSSQTAAVKIKILEKRAHKSRTVLSFWSGKASWMLHPKQEKCWQIHGQKRRILCRIARRSLLEHTALLAEAERKLELLAIYALPIGNYEHWICIHKKEGAWNANTGNGYYGGLQMNMGFQRFYGSEFVAKYGTADKWPPRVQMAVAQRAHDGYRGERPRGYGPWPNTARDCGLL